MEDKKDNINNTNEDVEILDFNDSNASLDNNQDNIIQNEVIDEVSPDKDNNIVNDTNDNITKEKVIKKETVKKIVTEQKVEDNKSNNNSSNNDKKIKEKSNNNDKNINTPSNNNVVVKEVVVKKKSIASIIVMIIVFLLLILAIFALPYVTEFLDKDKAINNQTSNNTEQTNQENNTIENNGEFKSGIDVEKALTDVKDIKSYSFENVTDVYVKDKNSETLSIKNDNIYSFNETKYKIEMNKLVADFSYDTVDYYEKLDNTYNSYLQDITTKEYTKSEINVDGFNTIYNLFPNTIDYLIEDNEVENEKQINVNGENHINITLNTSIDILKNLSFETNRIQNKIDISKLYIDGVNVDLYFDQDKNLYKIEFSIEDKNIYQEDIDGDIESAVSKYTFEDFNEIKDISIPSI